MSLKPVHIVQNPFFYPTGNTPAVCLTQNLPPDRDAVVLLLGCGDIRNILFTTYAGAGHDGRTFDFTCCDLEAEVIARNIVAFTLVIENGEDHSIRLLWNIYYHAFLDTVSFSHLQIHAQKLMGSLASVEAWNDGPYGSLIRFCDTATLASVVKVIGTYAVGPSNGDEYKSRQNSLKKNWELARKFKDIQHGDNDWANGVRASAPLPPDQAIHDIPKQYRTFWKTGCTFDDKKLSSKAVVANPMFGSLRSGLVLHYGTDPLLGFHLATAYAQLSSDSPLNQTTAKEAPKTFRMALSQFHEWCNAFRIGSNRITIRYVNADALAFCHVLDNYRLHGQSASTLCYRSFWDYSHLHLDTLDYGNKGTAPITFNVIDTSNLMDHLGSLNMLAAASPLMATDPAATMRTEMLKPRDKDTAESARMLLCGDLSTIALLFGLKPIHHWTNATATWQFNKSMLKGVPNGDMISMIHARHVVIWKPADTSLIKWQPFDLGNIMFGLYLEMFQDESLGRKFRDLASHSPDNLAHKFKQYELYTRGSFAAVLRRIKTSGVVEWQPFIDQLLEKIMADDSLTMGMHYAQSLFVHLSSFKLSSIDQYDYFHPISYRKDLRGPFRQWKTIPSIVCVTLVVPHEAVSMFADLTEKNGTPLCQLMLESSTTMRQSIYPDIQAAFGSISSVGTPFTNEYVVSVRVDDQGWQGSSPLVVSAMVSTYSLVDNGDTSCRVKFGLKNSPTNLMKFCSKLGLFLFLHESAVGKADVFVTKGRLNMCHDASLGQHEAIPDAKSTHSNIRLMPIVDAKGTKIVSIQAHYDLAHGKVKDSLQAGANAEFLLPDPFTLILRVGDTVVHKTKLPQPLDGNRGKGKIARKSLWAEYTAPVAEPTNLANRKDLVFPASINDKGAILLESLHYVEPNVLPALFIGKATQHVQWLGTHASTLSTMTIPEYAAYGKYLSRQAANKPGRMGVKETIFNMFMRIFGLNGMEKGSIFAFDNSSIPLATIFVDSVRMDPSNQTVFLDAALVPLSTSMQDGFDYAPINLAGVGVVKVNLDVGEAPFWRQLLPSFAERCRSWNHKSNCQYRTQNKYPLSTEPGERFMCSCGLGIFPQGYLKGLKAFHKITKYAVRVAIPVIFPSLIGRGDGIVPVPTTPPPTIPRPAPSFAPKDTTANDSGSRLVDLGAKKGTCFECGATEKKGGGPLSHCRACMFAQYCSAECQKANWRKGHKELCKQMKETAFGA
ncbi:hypothetical protein CC80DRAFT_571306 [Byssothecium circinans]|uniref:MYND-type domain-containing protein n=1 Tax=Byssothecium circinans TaxID=147558 RepID=A0A6A5TVE4_9PLEO|nr:hypothetical protein CC80DRAFT_571306 [Byssothecium circinans]